MVDGLRYPCALGFILVACSAGCVAEMAANSQTHYQCLSYNENLAVDLR
jgi:hypothetical protein